MGPKIYKIANRIKELESLKQAAESDEVKRSIPDPVPVPVLHSARERQTIIPGEPVRRQVQPRPERLRHMQLWEISLMHDDQELTPTEATWFRTRHIPDFGQGYGPNEWMKR